MKLKKLNTAILTALAGYSLSIPIASIAMAEEADENVEKIAVVGARGAPRSSTNSPVPVDVLSAEDISNVAFTDMNDVLQTLVPSYTLSRQPISDGGTFVRPAQLRGLPTDKTLVLVNSKRRHRAALVQIGGSGTQGPDLATIPVSAISTVEVLRDGAAAQYGSDAIAGVINFNLKDNTEGGSFSAEWGQYFEGDGQQITISGNKGFALGDDGFLSISAEYSDAEATFRGEQYCESWFCVDDQSEQFIADATAMGQSIHSSETVQPWGQPPTEGLRIFFNSGYSLGGDMELYSFGNYSESEGSGSFFYRYPGNGTIEDIRLEDGSVWSPLDIFPGGFTPRFAGDIVDYSLVAGIKGMSDKLGYDLSARYGYSEIAYTIFNTINPSMGNNTPTYFEPGDLSNEEVQLQADFTYDFDDYVFAFGASYMEEAYDITGGDPDSYFAGPYSGVDPWGFCDGTATADAAASAVANGLDCNNDDDPINTVVGVGSNGFPGFSPDFSNLYERESYAIYTDVSGDISDKLFGQIAVRYEDYSDFGSELVYKIAGIYQITDELAVRSSFGTGFRAPTPGQQGTTNVSTRLPNGFPVATGLFPAGGSVAQALGAEDLKPETSTNLTFGLTYNSGDFTLTVDYYNILLEDRLNAISTLDVSSDPDAGDAYDNFLSLEAAGVEGANSIGGVFYFQNIFDTVTEGVDVVATYNMESSIGDTVFTASFNYGTTEIDSAPTGFFNDEDVFDLENGLLETRGVFSAKHTYDAFQITARVSYYGEYENANNSSLEQIQSFGSEYMFDLEGTYTFNETYSLSTGVRNLFDNYPDPGTMGETCCGRIYRSDSIVDWQGGYYYLKFNARY
jgi:iron complex outermembrane receptor protein